MYLQLGKYLSFMKKCDRFISNQNWVMKYNSTVCLFVTHFFIGYFPECILN